MDTDNITNETSLETSPESVDTMELAKKRLEAELAMEGEERRKKREEENKSERERAERQKEKEDQKKLLQSERERREAAEREAEKKKKEETLLRSQEVTKGVQDIKTGVESLSSIRTLRADMDNLIKTNNLSMVNIALQEERKRKTPGEMSEHKTSLTIIITSSLLILSGISIGIYFYMYEIGRAPSVGQIISSPFSPKSLLPVEKTFVADVTGLSRDEIVSGTIRNAVRNTPDLLIGNVENIVLTKQSTQGTHYLDASEFFANIGANPPDSLVRSLNGEFMFGVLSDLENAGFIVLKTDSYDTAMAGLLAWEKTGMTKSLYQVLTTLIPDPAILSKQYTDMVVRNIDTRVLKDSNENIRIIYAFANAKNTLIIAGSENAFINALARFQTPAGVTK